MDAETNLENKMTDKEVLEFLSQLRNFSKEKGDAKSIRNTEELCKSVEGVIEFRNESFRKMLDLAIAVKKAEKMDVNGR